MYKAHAEKKKKETSSFYLQECLTSFESCESDNDKLEALLEIAQCVASKAFTDNDRSSLLGQIGLDFLLRLLKSPCVPDGYPPLVYKCIALSLLSSLYGDESSFMISQDGIEEFLSEINDIISSQDSQAAIPPHLLEDCIDVIAVLVQVEKGIDLLKAYGTLPLLLELALSPKCVKINSVLSSLSTVMKSRGDTIFMDMPEKFHALMLTAVKKLAQTNDMKEKKEYAVILTNFLSGISMIEIPESTPWITDLAKALKKILPLKLNMEDGTAFLQMMCAFVGAAGSQVLSAKVTGDASLLKVVVARLSVEVYVLLDNISTENAMERYPNLDRVYKLASNLVQYLAEGEELTDSELVVTVYKKLVDVTNTIMEFLTSVAHQEIDLPRNHIVVLISVRTLAAMLSEITEDPTPELLDLIPFFNFLCQTIEYSDDVKMEVKNVTQAALENIKLMSMKALAQEEEENSAAAATPPSPQPSASETTSPSSSTTSFPSITPTSSRTATPTATPAQDSRSHTPPVSRSTTPSLPQLKDTGPLISPQPPSLSRSSSGRRPRSQAGSSSQSLSESFKDLNVQSEVKQNKTGGKSVTFAPGVDEKGDSSKPKKPSYSKKLGYSSVFDMFQKGAGAGLLPESGDFTHVNGGIEQENSEAQVSEDLDIPSTSYETEISQPEPESKLCPTVDLSKESVEKFGIFQRALTDLRSQPVPLNQRQNSFVGKGKKKQGASVGGGKNTTVDSQHWQLTPEDVLGFILPTYSFLMDHEQAVKIMSECDVFQTVTNFLQKSLSQFLENESSVFPESMTMNGLSVIEHVYSNSPNVAAGLNCFQDLFELSLLSVPNLVSLPHPPTLICLKLIEVSLGAYKMQMRQHKRNASLPRLKHSQPRFFKAVVEYLASFYVFRRHRKLGLVLRVAKDYRDVWPLAEEYWCGSVAGLCTLLRDVEDLQEVYLKLVTLEEFLTFLHEIEDEDDSIPEELTKLTQSVLSLIESAALASDKLCDMVRHYHGLEVARKYRLKKLVKCLQGRQPQRSAAEADQ